MPPPANPLSLRLTRYLAHLPPDVRKAAKLAVQRVELDPSGATSGFRAGVVDVRFVAGI